MAESTSSDEPPADEVVESAFEVELAGDLEDETGVAMEASAFEAGGKASLAFRDSLERDNFAHRETSEETANAGLSWRCIAKAKA